MTQLPLTFDASPALTRDAFFAATSNAQALAWIDRWPVWPAHALVLVGPAGSGKSHLASIWAARTGATVHRAAGFGGADAPAVVVEDLRLLDPTAEVALFHLLNRAKAEGGHILLTDRTPPARATFGLPDLASRLRALPLATLEAPDDALLAALLAKQFADRRLDPAPDLIPWLIARMERSAAAAAHIAETLDRAALALKRRRVTLNIAKAALP